MSIRLSVCLQAHENSGIHDKIRMRGKEKMLQEKESEKTAVVRQSRTLPQPLSIRANIVGEGDSLFFFFLFPLSHSGNQRESKVSSSK